MLRACGESLREPWGAMDYLTLLVVGLSGYAGAPVWAIAAATIALASLSFARHHLLYRRGIDLGLLEKMNATLLRSTFNAFAASAMAYVAGITVRAVYGV